MSQTKDNKDSEISCWSWKEIRSTLSSLVVFSTHNREHTLNSNLAENEQIGSQQQSNSVQSDLNTSKNTCVKVSSPESYNLLRRQSHLISTFQVSHFNKSEMNVLLRFHRILNHWHREGKLPEHTHISEVSIIDEKEFSPNSSLDTAKLKGTIILNDAQCDQTISFLFGLTSCAICALEEEYTHYMEQLNNKNNPLESETVDPQKDIDRLLQEGRIQVEYERRKKVYLETMKFIQREILPYKFENDLMRYLGIQEWWDYDVVTERRWLNDISTWLGRQGDDELLINLIFDINTWHHKATKYECDDIDLQDKDNISSNFANASDLVSWCYRVALASHILQKCINNRDDTLLATTTNCDIQSLDDLEKSLLDAKSEFEQKCDDAELLSPHIDDNTIATSVISKLDDGNSKDSISRAVFKYWHKKYFPEMALSLSTFMHTILFPNLQSDWANMLYDGDDSKNVKMKYKRKTFFPTLKSSSENGFFPSQVSPRLYSLCCMSENIQGTDWTRLYSTNQDGRSFNRLEHAINGYDGPTLFLIRCFLDCNTDRTAIFGAFASSPWKKSADFYGSKECFLFQLYPKLNVMRTRNHKNAGKNQYLYTSSNNANCAQGIGFGGTTKKPRLFISETLETCLAGSNDSSYERGELVPAVKESNLEQGRVLELDCLEIYGLGGKDALQSMKSHRNDVETFINKARKVDKAAFLGDFRSGLIESKMFDHRQQMRDRDGGCLLDCYEEEENWQIGAPKT